MPVGVYDHHKIRGRKKLPRSSDHCRHLSEALEGRKESSETVEKKRISNKRFYTMGNHPWNYGLTKESSSGVLKQSRKMEGRVGPNRGKTFSQEWVKQLELGSQSRWMREEEHVKMSKALLRVWQCPEHREKMLGCLKKAVHAMLSALASTHPNCFEKRCGDYLNRFYPRVFDFVGDGRFPIEFSYPDYISQDLKIVVLCNGIYWHLEKFGLDDNAQNRDLIQSQQVIPYFEAGYKVWVIWEETDEFPDLKIIKLIGG